MRRNDHQADCLKYVSQNVVDMAIAYLDSESYPVAGKFVRRVTYIVPPTFWPYLESKA